MRVLTASAAAAGARLVIASLAPMVVVVALRRFSGMVGHREQEQEHGDDEDEP